jgi:hypothetical protein
MIVCYILVTYCGHYHLGEGGMIIVGVHNTVRSESCCALRLQYVDLIVSIEVAVVSL